MKHKKLYRTNEHLPGMKIAPKQEINRKARGARRDFLFMNK